MPKIAEIEVIDGELWVKVDSAYPDHENVTLFNDEEIREVKRQVIREVLELIQDLYLP